VADRARGRRRLAIALTGAALAPLLALGASTPLGIAAAETPPTPPPVGPQTDQLIVRFSGATTDLGLVSDEAGDVVTSVRQLSDGAVVLKLPEPRPQAEVEVLAEALEELDAVVSAEADVRMFPTAVPNDPEYANQWHLAAPSVGIFGADLPGAWDITTGSLDVVIAVIDTGKRDHADLAGRFVPGYDMIANVATANDGDGRDGDPSDPGDGLTSSQTTSGVFAGCPNANSTWHGTHVAGTIGASANNGLGVAGINWTSKILPVRVLGRCGGYTSDVVDGIRWAAGLPVPGAPANANPAKVLNLSLGGAGACSGQYQSAIDAVVGVGATVVVAAGNDATDAADFSPASCANVLTVAATNKAGGRAYYSNFGDSVDIAAPGGETNVLSTRGIRSTSNTGPFGPGVDSYAYYQGTSMAAPHVSGVVSLMLSSNPSLTTAQVRSLLRANVTAFPGGSSCAVSYCGSGILDAAAAVAASQASAAQSNDAFASAIPFALPGPSPLSGSTVGASTEPGEPVHAGVVGSSSIWWSITPTRNGRVSLSTAGSGVETVLAVYTGVAVGTLSPVAANASCLDLGQPESSCLTVPLAEGTTYWIAVGGRLPAVDGPISLGVAWTTVPSATPPPVVTRTTGRASVAFAAPYDDGGSAVVSYEATCTSFNGGVTRSATGAGSPILVTSLTSGAGYRCTVQASNALGSGWLSDPSLPFADPPSNDGFWLAPLVSTSDGVTRTSWTSGATKQPGEPNHAGNIGGKSVWWKVVPPMDGSVRLNTYGSGFDTVLGLYTGDSVSTLTLVAASDDCGGYESCVSQPVTGGVTYYIAVDGYNDGAGADSGLVRLQASFASYPAQMAAPTVTAGAPGSGTVSATFTPPTFSGSSPIVDYWVNCWSNDGGVRRSQSGPTSPIEVASLTPGKSYSCVVGARNSEESGVNSPASNVVAVRGLGSLAGRIRSDATFGLKGTKVTLYDGATSLLSVTTDENGNWSIPDLPTSVDYRLRFRDPRGDHLTEFHANASTLAASTPVAVTHLGTTTVHASLTPVAATATVGGTVRSGASPIAGIQVTLYRNNVSVRSVTTAADGTWSVAGLDVGADWRVRFRSLTGAYVLEYHADASSFGFASPLTLVSVGSVTVDASLQATADLATVSGTVVRDGGSTPLVGVQVRLYQGTTVIATTVTGAGGAYRATIVDSGVYTLRFHDPTGAHVLEWYDGSPTQSGATPVVLVAGSNVTASLAMVATAPAG